MFLALYGENVNLGDAIFISIFAMAVVFVVLLIISYMIDLVAFVLNRKLDKRQIVKENPVSVDTRQNDDLVAVIAAAIAAYTGNEIQNINIKKIRRIDNKSMWMRRN